MTQRLDTAALMVDAFAQALETDAVIASEIDGLGSRVWRHDARTAKGSIDHMFKLPAIVVRLVTDAFEATPGEMLDPREIDGELHAVHRDGYVDARLEVWVYATGREQLSRLVGAVHQVTRPIHPSRRIPVDLVTELDDDVESLARFTLASGAERSPAVIDEGYAARRIEIDASGARYRCVPTTTKDTITTTLEVST